MKRKGFLTAALLITALSATLMAQQPPGGPRPGPPPNGGPGGPPPPNGGGDRGLVEFLHLTDAQKASWQQLQEAFRTSSAPLVEQRHELEATVHDLLEVANPDALAVGQAVVGIDKASDQLRAAHQTLDDALEATLTAEQKLRFEAWQAATRAAAGGVPPGPRP